MTKQIRECDRCESKIVEESHHMRGPGLVVTREVSPNKIEEEEVFLCSMCWDDLWEWALGETPDRSDVADPIPLERMAEGVDRHIAELKDILTEIEEETEGK